MANRVDYLELGLICADVYGALKQRMKGPKADQSNQFVLEAIKQLETWVEPAGM